SLQQNSADTVPALLGEPDVPVGTRRDTSRLAVFRRNGEFGNLAVGLYSPDPASPELAKPEIHVRAEPDENRLTERSGKIELVDRLTIGRDASDPVACDLGEPHVSVGSSRDIRGSAVRIGELKLGDLAGG